MTRTALLFAIGITLAACGGGTKQPPTAQDEKTGAAAEAQAPRQAKTETAMAPTKPPEPVNDDPQQFMGLDRPAVMAIIGKPALVRRDGPAEVWQYRGEGCVLDIFMYRQDEDRFSVDYIDLRAPDLAEDRHRACLADIIRKSRQPATS